MKRRLAEGCHCYKDSLYQTLSSSTNTRKFVHVYTSRHEDVWVNRGKAPQLQTRILTSASDENELWDSLFSPFTQVNCFRYRLCCLVCPWESFDMNSSELEPCLRTCRNFQSLIDRVISYTLRSRLSVGIHLHGVANGRNINPTANLKVLTTDYKMKHGIQFLGETLLKLPYIFINRMALRIYFSVPGQTTHQPGPGTVLTSKSKDFSL